MTLSGGRRHQTCAAGWRERCVSAAVLSPSPLPPQLLHCSWTAHVSFMVLFVAWVTWNTPEAQGPARLLTSQRRHHVQSVRMNDDEGVLVPVPRPQPSTREQEDLRILQYKEKLAALTKKLRMRDTLQASWELQVRPTVPLPSGYPNLPGTPPRPSGDCTWSLPCCVLNSYHSETPVDCALHDFLSSRSM